MEKVDYTELIVEACNISNALAGLQSMLSDFPNADDVKSEDISRIDGIVAAISILAQKNQQVVADYFE